jgi:hypothetical protein
MKMDQQTIHTTILYQANRGRSVVRLEYKFKESKNLNESGWQNPNGELMDQSNITSLFFILFRRLLRKLTDFQLGSTRSQVN